MEGSRVLKNSQIIILGLCISAATIASTILFSKALIQIKRSSIEVIQVTGSAEKNIISDYAVWKSDFSRRSPDMTAAYSALREDLEKVKKYLTGNGVSESEMSVRQVATKILYRKNEKGNDTNDIEGYLLTQGIEVRSNDVAKVLNISQQSTEIINQGIQFISQPPDFFYTKLAELKIEMLARATQDAKSRAENMTQSVGIRIGVMRSARMGVFQITPANSLEVCDYGLNDTTSMEKKVTAVVHASFAIDGTKA